MKAKNKPRFVKEARKLFHEINIDVSMKDHSNSNMIFKINRLIAIFTSFSSNDGQELKRLLQEFQKWSRRSTSTGTIKNKAIDMIQFIGQKIEEMDIYQIEDVREKIPVIKPAITATKHMLNFQNLSSNDFVRLCFWILKRSDDYEKVENYEGMGDKQRDVVAYTFNGEKHYYQCKRYQKISASTLKTELDLLKAHCDKNIQFKPGKIYFVVGCSVSPKTRDVINEYGSNLGFKNITIWSNVEFDERAKVTKGAVEEFFGFDTQLIRVVMQETLKSNKNAKEVLQKDTPVLDLESLARSGGPSGQFIRFKITNLSQTQTAMDCQWEVRGFNYSFRSLDEDCFSLQPTFSKEIIYRLDGEKLHKDKVREISFIMEYSDVNGIFYFTRRELMQVEVPSKAFYELKRGKTFYPAEQLKDIGIKNVSAPILNSDRYQSNFDVSLNGKEKLIVISISRTFISLWGLLDDDEAIKAALAELGSRIVRKMILKRKLEDYIFVTDNFPPEYQKGFNGYKLLRDSL